jgi:hypothetical protein
MDAICAAVVLDVARLTLGREVGFGRWLAALELIEDHRVGDAHHLDEDVQAAPMGHAELDGPGAGPSDQLDDLVQHRNEDVEALDREPLLAEVRTLEEALEGFHGRQPGEELALIVRGEGDPVRSRLDRLPQPRPLVMAVDVLDLVGDRPAIGATQFRQDIRQGCARQIDTQQVGRDAR